MSFLQLTFYSNTLLTWMTALLVMLAALLVLRIVKGIIARRLIAFARRTETRLDDLFAELVAKTKLFFLLILSIYAGSMILTLPDRIVTFLEYATVIAFLIQAGIWGSRCVVYLVSTYVKLEGEEVGRPAASQTALIFIGKLVLWSLVLLLVLDNMEVDITALVASLGIGGIAVALATQNILGDLFASLSIVLDQPFVVGDFVIVGDHLGSVEHIGLKSTRLRSLSGEQLIFSNTDLLNSRIRNFKRMSERRVVFSVGVTYQTPYEKLCRISSLLREIVESQDLVRFDRAHFKGYGDSSLNFEVVYWVESADYNLYMDVQERINLEIYRRFEREGLEFAYPTRTLFVHSEVA